jgi:hypothetical protein
MAASRGTPSIWLGIAALLLFYAGPAAADPDRVDNIEQVFARFYSCWRAPSTAHMRGGIDITVIATFTRDGSIMGHPRITHESEWATDDERLQLRIAVMETLQRCTPMPFTEGMAGAVAGRPFAIRFRN